MRKLVAYVEKCNGCGLCEEICSKTYFKEVDKSKSAIRVMKDGNNCRIEICDQCGDCTKMCTSLAVLKAANGVVRITKEKCVGCLICVGECLRGFMHYHDDEPVPFKCVACGLCAKQCPTGTLALVDEE
jgi:Fe-S-cluster-containing hydrogenase component 2